MATATTPALMPSQQPAPLWRVPHPNDSSCIISQIGLGGTVVHPPGRRMQITPELIEYKRNGTPCADVHEGSPETRIAIQALTAVRSMKYHGISQQDKRSLVYEERRSLHFEGRAKKFLRDMSMRERNREKCEDDEEAVRC